MVNVVKWDPPSTRQLPYYSYHNTTYTIKYIPFYSELIILSLAGIWTRVLPVRSRWHTNVPPCFCSQGKNFNLIQNDIPVAYQHWARRLFRKKSLSVPLYYVLCLCPIICQTLPCFFMFFLFSTCPSPGLLPVNLPCIFILIP